MSSGLEIFLSFSALFVGQIVAILLHELGHVLAASACGWKPMFVKVGSGRSRLSFMVGDLQFAWTALPLSGLARAYPRSTAHFRLKSAVFALGGPLATFGIIVAIWPVFQLAGPDPNWLGLGLGWLAILQVVMLGNSLIPRQIKIDGRMLANDMLLVWQAWRLKKEEVPLTALANVLGGARVYLERGQLNRAQALFEETLARLEPADRLAAGWNWIHLLLSDGKQEQAVKQRAAMMDGWRNLKGSRVEVLDSLACFPLYLGWPEMIEESLRDIEMAIQEAPEMITLKGTKCSLLIEAGRVDEGLKLLEEVAASTESENDLAIVSFYRALAYLKMGDRTKARHLLREAGEKYPRCLVRQRIEQIFWTGQE